MSNTHSGASIGRPGVTGAKGVGSGGPAITIVELLTKNIKNINRIKPFFITKQI